MNAEEMLRERAAKAAASVEQRTTGLETEIFDLEAALANKKAELDAANGALERLNSYVPSLGGQLQCPDCWVFRQRHESLVAVPGGRYGIDLFRCPHCPVEMNIPH